ncbi:nonstructural protein [Capybara microvirus Cap3_SP_441]|nr:nonstructural protein [Capybara microvirus Cap3_SP_441]
MKLYAIKDKAMGFNSPFGANNNYHAQRMTADSMRDEKSLLSTHPEDYDLYELGEYDTDTGTIKPEVKFMNNLSDFKA